MHSTPESRKAIAVGRRELDRRPSKPATPRPGFTFDRVPTDIELVEAVDDALACRMLLGSTARTLGT